MSWLREATPSGTSERRFRGSTFGNGANVTLCWTGSDDVDAFEDWLSRITVGDGVTEESTSTEYEGYVLVGISMDSDGNSLSGDIFI